jgi:hypothetical protein
MRLHHSIFFLFSLFIAHEFFNVKHVSINTALEHGDFVFVFLNYVDVHSVVLFIKF